MANPSKDQMRLMMQSLLAERFKLAVHFETHDVPVMALVLVEPGKLGFRLRPHSQGPPCDAKIPPVDHNSPKIPDVWRSICGDLQLIEWTNNTVILGSRNTTMEMLADYVPALVQLDHPVVDQTGLNGEFDYELDFAPPWRMPKEQSTDTQLDLTGPTFFEALKDQLGLKLKPTRAPFKPSSSTTSSSLRPIEPGIEWSNVENLAFRTLRPNCLSQRVPSRFSPQRLPQKLGLIRSWYVNARSTTESSEMEVTNSERLDAIFRAHYERITRVIGRVIHDQARAEELAVEVFLKWWRNPQAHGEQAEGWLYRTSVREALDELRRQTRRSRFERLFSFVREAPPTPEHLFAVTAEQHRVRTVLGGLNRRHAELLLLWSQGRSYQEIAVSLAVTSNYVGSLVSRAQEAFRKEYLKRYGNQS